MSIFSRSVGAACAALTVLAGAGLAVAETKTLIVVQSAEPVGLDAMQNNLQHSLNVALNIQDRLFDPLEDGGVAPGLAASWEFPEPTKLVVTLKPGLTFHNGEPVNAEAVRFSFERLVNAELASPHAGRMAQIEAVRVIDDLTVEFTTKAPFAPILHLMSYYLPILPPVATAATEKDAFNRMPIGAGPYMVESWDRGGDVVLTAFEGYWDGAPAYDKVIFRTIPEESARVASFVTGESQIIEGVSVRSQQTIEKSGKGTLTDSMGVMPYVGLNTLAGPFADQRVRQAVNYGVNRALIKAALFNDRGMLAAGPISPRTFGADLTLEPYPYDVEKAKALLAEAGFPDGFETRLSYPTNMTQIQEQAQAIAADLEKIGVRAKLEPLDRAVMWEKYQAKEHEMFIYWWDDNPEPDRYMYSLFHSNSRDYFYDNPATDAALDLGRSTLDRDERARIYGEIDRALYEEAPWLYLYIIPETYAVAPDVTYVGRRDGFLFMRFAEPAAAN
ncbi:ABC transporter substrate-binding protein [Paracoccaceae bacterium Fryx2]|nr:ABC transporter substrate-binding protein [Paracoccaceae bacterium Fryx2]